MLHELRNLIKLILNESSSRVGSGPGIVLTRMGGLSPVPTSMSPEPRGLYAFIHGKIEPFMVGSTDSRGITDDERPSRGALNRASHRPVGDRDPSLGLRYFRYDGPIWTHFDLHGGEPAAVEGVRGPWFRTTARELREYIFGKKHVEDFKVDAGRYNDEMKERGKEPKRFLPSQWKNHFSKDDFEVFIPARGGKFMPYEDDPRRRVSLEDELPERRRSSMKAKIARSKEIMDREEEKKQDWFYKTTSPFAKDAPPSWQEREKKENEEIRAIWDRGQARGRYKEFENFEEFLTWMKEKKREAKLKSDEYQHQIEKKKEK
jgi:hypothetical protein